MLVAFKKIAVPLMGLAIVAGTLFLDDYLQAKTTKKIPEVTMQGLGGLLQRQDEHSYMASARADNPVTLMFSQNAIIRLAPGTNFQFTILQKEDFTRRLEGNLEKGRLWINTLNSIMETEIKMGSLSVLALPGIFDIQEETDVSLLTSHRRNLEIDFLKNRLLLPEHRSISIEHKKLIREAETIGKLRYAKLIKEFPYFEKANPDPWTLENFRNDERFLEKYQKSITDKIKEKGTKIPQQKASLLFQFHEFIPHLQAALTFDPERKGKIMSERIFDYFDASVYSTMIGQDTLALEWLEHFKNLSRDLSQPNRAFDVGIREKQEYLAFTQPRDPLAKAKGMLRERAQTPALQKIHEAFDDVLDLSNSGNGKETQEKLMSELRRYRTIVQENLPKSQREASGQKILFENLRLYDFLSRHPKLLREEFFKITESFEHRYLEFVASREEADDERQFFILEKLKHIKTIQNLLETGDIAFQEGRRSILLLNQQIEALKPTFADSAVISYMEDQLRELAPFLAFLRSPGGENLRGSFSENFSEFQSNLEELKKVNELLSKARGGTNISPIRREELAATVSKDFHELGMTEIKIVLPEVEDDPTVHIVSAQMEGVTLSGIYDTARKIFSEIVIDEESIENAIRLENFKKFFLIKTGKLVIESGLTPESLAEPVSKTSLLEKVAKTKFLEELKKLNIQVEEKYLGFEDFSDGIIHVALAKLGDGADAKVFSFHLFPKGNTVNNLRVQTVSGEIPVNDTLSLRELPIKVEQIFKRAIFEKQKEEELKKFSELGTTKEKN